MQDGLYRTRKVSATPLRPPRLALFLVATPVFSRLYEVSPQTERRHCRSNILLHIVTDLMKRERVVSGRPRVKPAVC